MSDEQFTIPDAQQAIDAFELERKLLEDLEKSSEFLGEIYSELRESARKVFEIFNKELDAKDDAGNFKMTAMQASLVHGRMTDSFTKLHKQKLDTIGVLHGMQENGSAETGDDINNNVEDDLPDSVRRAAQKALHQFFKEQKAKTPNRKYKRGQEANKRKV